MNGFGHTGEPSPGAALRRLDWGKEQFSHHRAL